MKPWPRAMPALITPFTASYEIDLDAHRRNIEAMAARGASGVLISGSTGEGPYLEDGERGALVAAAKDMSPSLTVVCGINAESVRQALAQVDEVTGAGADALLVITPTTLVRGRMHLVESFFEAVAEAAHIPMMLYTVPGVTGYELPTEAIASLALHPNIIGMKDSGGDASRLETLAETVASGFVVYAGASRSLAASAKVGAWGAITASANYALSDVSMAAQGDATAQRRLVTLTTVIETFGVAGTKLAASMTGLEAGASRPPLPSTLGAEAREAIRSTLMEHGLISTQ